jgi:hypothetical protein
MIHTPHTPTPPGARPPRSLLRRLAIHAAWVLALPVGVLLTLSIVTAHILSSSGHTPRGEPPVVTRYAESVAGGSRARDPGGGPGPSAAGSGPHLQGTPVSVSVTAHPLGAAVPGNFLGLSFEMRSLPTIAGYATRGNLVALLRSLGSGVLRFGGISADEQVAWVGPGGTKPGWASVAISEADLAGLAALVRATGWRVLLTVNLAHYEPSVAAQEAAAAQRLLGGYLAGIEIGNEPDLFVGKGLRPAGWGYADYVPQAATYRAAIAAAAPGVPIAGPDPATGLEGLNWLHAVAVSPTLRPGLLTDHYYPLSSCGGENPTVSELLSPNVRRSESALLKRMVAIARAHGTPLRVDETNNISCEGQPGVSDTFASALWALDYTARAIAAGVVGVNFHDLLGLAHSYSPLFAPSPAALAAGALHAAPEWYALLAAHAFIGSPKTAWEGGRPLPTGVAAAPGELTASALRASDGRLALVLVDYDPPGSPPLAVHLDVPRDLGGGSVLRLTAPSPTATSGVRLGGRAVAPDGSFSPPPVLPRVSGRAGSLAVQMPPDSAAVVTLSPTRAIGHEALPR